LVTHALFPALFPSMTGHDRRRCRYNARSIKEPVITGLVLSGKSESSNPKPVVIFSPALGSLIYANAATSMHIIIARCVIICPGPPPPPPPPNTPAPHSPHSHLTYTAPADV
jgi:hypothetical protein